MKILCTLPLLILAVVDPAFAQSRGDWSVSAAQGYLEHMVHNGSGNDFNISCDIGATEEGGADIFINIAGTAPPPNSTVRLFIDGSEIQMGTDDQGTVVTNCRVCTANFQALWEELRFGNQFVVALEDGRSSPFSLRGSAGALDPQPCSTGFF